MVNIWFKHNHKQKNRGIKVPEVQGSKKGIDPNLRPEWLVRKSQKSVVNSKIEKKETDSPGQRNQVVDQVNSGQRDEIRKSQMEQSRENIPEQMHVPQKSIIPMHPNQISNPYQNYQKEGYRMIDRQIWN